MSIHACTQGRCNSGRAPCPNRAACQVQEPAWMVWIAFCWHYVRGYVMFFPWRDTHYSAARYARLMTKTTTTEET